MRRVFAFAAAVFALLGSLTEAHAEQRMALVIANAEYHAFDRLDATQADGEKIAAALTGTGFSDASGEGPVRVLRNLGHAQLVQALTSFRARLMAAGPDTFGVLYYSGHGVALGPGGDVMMVPVDTDREKLTAASAFSRVAVTRGLMQSGAQTILVVLDMCRNVIDPGVLARTSSLPAAPVDEQPTGTKGFKRIVRGTDGRIRPDQGYLVAYSTSTDQFAFDDGIFSKILAEEIRRPRQSIADAMKRVSDRVALKVGGAYQKPTFDYGLQGSPPCFVSCDPSGQDRFYDCANCPWMRAVPAGVAMVGSPVTEDGRDRDELDQREETIRRGFALGVYEVTVAEWIACERNGACPRLANWARENPNPLVPATSISRDDAMAFLAWLSAESGRAYRLPTEIEWEYASRAGATTIFPWGDGIGPSDGNYDHSARYGASSTAPYRGYPEAVNAYPPNAFGIYQMLGNVWEWTSGCADADCRKPIARGGSFDSVPGELRPANRFAIDTRKRRDDVGLRVARDLDADEVGGAR